VYKARVRSTGRVVAVKVQRPKVREAIALDIYIMRYLAGRWTPPPPPPHTPQAHRSGVLRKVNSDLPGLLYKESALHSPGVGSWTGKVRIHSTAGLGA